jgi:hypothetical protein
LQVAVAEAEAEAVSGKALQTDSMEAWDAFRLAIAAETGRPIDDPFVMSAAHAMQAICSGLVNTLEHGWGDGRLYIEKHQLVGSAFAPLVKHRWGP